MTHRGCHRPPHYTPLANIPTFTAPRNGLLDPISPNGHSEKENDETTVTPTSDKLSAEETQRLIALAEQVSPSYQSFHCEVEYTLTCNSQQCGYSRPKIEHFTGLSIDIPDRLTQTNTTAQPTSPASMEPALLSSPSYMIKNPVLTNGASSSIKVPLSVPSITPAAAGAPAAPSTIARLVSTYFNSTQLECRCPKCPATHVTVTSLLKHFPRVLILHLKRFQYSEKYSLLMKRTDMIRVDKTIQISIDNLNNAEAAKPVTMHIQGDAYPNRANGHEPLSSASLKPISSVANGGSMHKIQTPIQQTSQRNGADLIQKTLPTPTHAHYSALSTGSSHSTHTPLSRSLLPELQKASPPQRSSAQFLLSPETVAEEEEEKRHERETQDRFADLKSVFDDEIAMMREDFKRQCDAFGPGSESEINRISYQHGMEVSRLTAKYESERNRILQSSYEEAQKRKRQREVRSGDTDTAETEDDEIRRAISASMQDQADMDQSDADLQEIIKRSVQEVAANDEHPLSQQTIDAAPLPASATGVTYTYELCCLYYSSRS